MPTPEKIIKGRKIEIIVKAIRTTMQQPAEAVAEKLLIDLDDVEPLFTIDEIYGALRSAKNYQDVRELLKSPNDLKAYLYRARGGISG